MKRTTVLLVALLFGSPVLAQPAWNTLSQAVQDVQIKDDMYEQSFSYTSDNACLLTFTVLDTDDGEETTYKVNAADLNEHKIRFDTRSREVVIEVETRGDKELVQVFEDGEAEDFSDNFQFYAVDIENARAIVKAFKEVVQNCGEQSKEILIYGKANPTFEDALGFLTAEVGEIETSDGAINQTLAYDLSLPTIITYEQEDANEGEVNSYVANMVDFNEQSVSFDTKRGQVLVTLETIGGRDLIQTLENGEADDYEHELQIIATDIEQGRALEKALKALITQAEQRYDNSFLPGVNNPSLDQTVSYLTSQVGNVALEKETYEQSVNYDAATQQFSYTIIEASEGEEVTFLVNPADINPRTIDFDTKGSEVLIELKTEAERDLVQELEDDVVDGFTDEIVMQAPSVDEARRWVGALRQLVTLAQANQQNLFVASVGSNPTPGTTLQFLRDNIGTVDEGDDRYEQSFTPGSDQCLLTYTLIDDEGEEKVFEWNMADMNPRLVTFDTKGERIIVTLKTTAQRDLVREIEQGEVEGYENEVELLANTIEEARALVSAFKNLAESCKK
ncbi:hypothetical protein [Tunicatimonas pelagia]|uniref:hypothetical protein n=1 Tax=Tunicatimonas pelagia TaxID=931531 RepID=UPI00266514D6|nr:hypothetical protein [Tunicatimonas pelagia]WKN44426.1 hypothetical protein P0M28_05540 [Tunicatimonas pelagia]